MGVSDGFIDLLKDLLGGLGPVSVRRMFGGAGLFADGVMFGLVARDTLYFKADPSSQSDFAAEGAQPFGYMVGERRHVIASYWQAPERLLDDPDEICRWARRALEVAKRNPARPARGKRATQGASA